MRDPDSDGTIYGTGRRAGARAPAPPTQRPVPPTRQAADGTTDLSQGDRGCRIRNGDSVMCE